MARFLVVTPVLNCLNFIQDSLATVATQTDGDWVHYYVDGGSTDGTIQALENAALEDARIRVIVGSDRGLYDARFKGHEQAEVDAEIDERTICVWLGADDLLMPWAFATLRKQFDNLGADWIASLPTIWDVDKCLQIVYPFNWYPKRFIRAGLFNNSILGSLQTESIFFTQGLLNKVPKEEIAKIRCNKYAGDFLLWREFARHTELVSIMTVVSGFRLHGENLSTLHESEYLSEVCANGIWLPPKWMGRILRASFQQIALLRSQFQYRSAWVNFKVSLQHRK
jgi:glycosyltransferase involved in cell wall biosynthesis